MYAIPLPLSQDPTTDVTGGNGRNGPSFCDEVAAPAGVRFYSSGRVKRGTKGGEG